MPLIDTSFNNLANPPSLASCTRDIYPNDKKLSLTHALNIALGSASAIQHLHAKGIMHGDCYAHNILHNDDGNCLLGDFGAASFFPKEHAEALQRIETRAYACLLEELIDRCIVSNPSQILLQAMRNLQNDCEQTEVAKRPKFAEITHRLSAIKHNISRNQNLC
jgi:predicted unusual protein kinase regulating ubiquinone biosynthesis (AarF/ABC1/UbiB family)